MSSLVHIIFEIVRISILSFVYGFLFWWLLKLFTKSRLLKKRFLIPLLFILIFVWRFSYWRNNGLGDFGRVPIGKGHAVEMIDFHKARIVEYGMSVDMKGRADDIDKLYVEDGIVYYTTGTQFRIYDSAGEKSHINNLTIEEFKLMGGNPRKLMSPDEFHSDYWGYGILFY